MLHLRSCAARSSPSHRPRVWTATVG
jgi:hypothetical protein